MFTNLKAVPLALFLASAISAFAQSPAVTLDWKPNPANPPGTTYNPKRATGECGTPGQVFTNLSALPVAGLTYVDTTVSRGMTYCFHVTAGQGPQESAPSLPAVGRLPYAPPGELSLSIDLNAAAIIKINGVEVARQEIRGSTDIPIETAIARAETDSAKAMLERSVTVPLLLTDPAPTQNAEPSK